MRRPIWIRMDMLRTCVLLSTCAVFFCCVVHAITTSAELSSSVRTSMERSRGAYVAEDVFRRALTRIGELRSGARIVLAEGELSTYPDRETWVELRDSGTARHFVCGLTRDDWTLYYRSVTTRGELPDEFRVSLAELEPSEIGEGVVFESAPGDASLARGATRLAAMPLRDEHAWEQVDFVVDARALADCAGRNHELNQGNFRVADDVALAQLERPTGLTNFEIGHPHGERLVAAFRGPRDLVVRVRGHLFLGRPDRKLLVGTGGRSLVLLVDGNVRIRGSVELLGDEDRLFVVAGRPGYGAFRDANGNGIHDEGELALAPHASRPVLTPVEGGGLIYVGDDKSRPVVQAGLVASQDLIVAATGAELRGPILCRKLLRLGASPGALVFHEPAPAGRAPMPIRGLPVVPGTEMRERVQPPVFWKARKIRPSHAASDSLD